MLSVLLQDGITRNIRDRVIYRWWEKSEISYTTKVFKRCLHDVMLQKEECLKPYEGELHVWIVK